MRLVVDTNIWISGLLWQGMPWKLLCLAEQGELELCMAPPMFEELAEVLAYERLRPRLDQLGLSPDELLAYAVSLAAVFEIPEQPGTAIVVADPDDDIFLRCATVSGAVCVVSGDHHLLDLGEYAGIPILTVRSFFDEFYDL